ncbi:lytic polysaccharide monooxygenase [Streptomyces sp. ITFR-16]|uniref:lytic polysaccharide monooxygenase auxiliary activity family 9 protein n=1 Tax=Streptomyces sp. ITFR-16 TaxID=3075198 RepID=UPI00288B306F|nr:lytic polysaccharide monooxygenase [Streptomyces sp. ITFR-16]WNI25614.1 lytic polysaccharide monooxygenase [Streptomyces sp. ITFR-16]
MAANTPARRRTATLAALGALPLALTALAAVPAAAHGSLTDPVSRVSACFAEGPENPRSAACVAAVAAGGTQALYDWNGVNIANAAGNHRRLIPDGKLCSAGNDKFKGLDLPRADWPATKMAPGRHTFRFRATAPHKGSFALYLTTSSYDPAKPLKWSDLEEKPFAEATDPQLVDGSYVFDGTVPDRAGRQLIYTVWQRSDSPEAFYACSDVVFDGAGQSGEKQSGTSGSGSVAAVPQPSASAPTEQEITKGEAKSSVEHGGHGDDDARTGAKVTEAAGTPGAPAVNAPEPDSASAAPAPAGEELAETGGDGSTAFLTIGGAAALAVGAGVLFLSVRRRAVSTARHGR